jgi:hypothetical protein
MATVNCVYKARLRGDSLPSYDSDREQIWALMETEYSDGYKIIRLAGSSSSGN